MGEAAPSKSSMSLAMTLETALWAQGVSSFRERSVMTRGGEWRRAQAAGGASPTPVHRRAMLARARHA
jgi:hypothetical protein